MRILILTNFDVGLYQFRRELIQELLTKNEVYISLPYGELVAPLVEMGCFIFDTPMERRGMNPVRDAKLFAAYRRIFREVKPEKVICYTIKPNIYGGFAARLAGIPYAVNITGLGTAFESGGLLKKMVTAMYRLSCKKAKTVFCENAENRQIFLNAKIVKERQTCLLSGAGVNLERYAVADYPAGDVVKFLFIGRIMREKGVDELLSAMRRLTGEGVPCTLDMVGGYEEDYGAVVEEAESEGWLKYWGYQEDVRPFIAASHCFVLPSCHEGMANTNLECAASGRPVITSRIHGCMEAVEDGVTGFLCERKDSGSLYAAMKRFCALSMEERRAMGLAGRKRMEAVFDKKSVVEETIKRL